MREAPLIAAAFLLTVGLAALLGRLAGQVWGEGAPRLTAVATAVAAFSAATLLGEGGLRRFGSVAWAGLSGLAALAALASVPRVSLNVVGALAVGVTVVVWLHGAAAKLLAAETKAGDLPGLWVFTTMVGMALAPVWAAPALLGLNPPQWLIDGVVAASPLTLLAALAHFDVLRADWFYTYGPIGGVRFAYPPAGPLAAAYAALAFTLSALASWRAAASRPRSGKDPSASGSPSTM